ncbi:MAG: NAD-binding protein, partial [Polyangiaceae bacterium]|nr:NAD-binding protein [Polyangiaceae bacterium]
ALEHVHVDHARAVVITVEDRVGARRIVQTVRALNPHAYLLVRTRYVTDADELKVLGATEIVAEELESSLELSSRVMAAYGASPSAIFVEKSLVRRDGYRLLFGQEVPSDMPTLRELLTSADLMTFEVEEGSEVCGRTLASLDLRKHHQVSVLSIERGGGSLVNPSPDLELEPGDRVVVFGMGDALRAAAARFERRGGAH